MYLHSRYAPILARYQTHSINKHIIFSKIRQTSETNFYLQQLRFSNPSSASNLISEITTMSVKKEEEPEQIEEDDDENDEDQEELPPTFTNSAAFAFMTDEAYKRLEEDDRTEITSGKLFKHVRPMRARVGVLENPHGSVRLWQGGTSVLAAVYGPSDVKISKELPHRAAVDILFRPKVTGNANVNAMIAAGMMDPVQEERAIEQTVTSILESVIYLEDHVQAGFNVILHEFQDEGCLLSTCINACALALLNAGCSLRSLFAAVTIYISGEKVLVDPSKSQVEELMKSSQPPSVLTVTCMNDSIRLPKVIHMHSKGRVSAKVLKTCYEYVCSDAIFPEIFGFFAGVVSNDLGGLMSSVKSTEDVEKMEVKEDSSSEYEDIEEGEL